MPRITSPRLPRNPALVEAVGDDRVELTAEGIPLQLEIAGQGAARDEELDDFLLPELAVARGESRLDVGVEARPAEVQRGVVIPRPHHGRFTRGTLAAGGPSTMPW